MKILHKSLLGLAAFMCSGAIFAACPQIGGYTLSGHNANNTQCTYTANQANLAAAHNPKLCSKNFILTDPHYKVIHCKYVHRCVCTISSK